MGRAGIEQILYLVDSGFDGPDWHSLQKNINTVRPDEWLWVPPGGRYSIRTLVHHLGACKYVYENWAFGDQSYRWDDPLVDGVGQLDTIESAMAWVRRGHAVWRASIAALEDDEELLRPRLVHWGEPKETRWLIATMLQHDLYHAGEINHIRALSQQNEGEDGG